MTARTPREVAVTDALVALLDALGLRHVETADLVSVLVESTPSLPGVATICVNYVSAANGVGALTDRVRVIEPTSAPEPRVVVR